MKRTVFFTVFVAMVILISSLVSCHSNGDNHVENSQSPEVEADAEHVILLHGLARSPNTMKPMAEALRNAGYQTIILDYPSRSMTIPELSDQYIGPAVQMCQNRGAKNIHFVTHSLGGILVRDFLSRHHLTELGRVVMLAPPNNGSEVVDQISHWRSFKFVNGPVGGQLGTDSASAPNALGPVNYPVGVIAGDRSINPINSCMIPGPDDGKVSIKNTKVTGMTDHIVIHRTHPMIMKGKDAIQYTLQFLKTGEFIHEQH